MPIPTIPTIGRTTLRKNEANEFYYGGKSIEVRLTQYNIAIGCTDMDPQLVLFLAEQWKENFAGTKAVTFP